MFMTPVISGSARVNNDTFGLMPLNALNGSDSPQPIQADFSSVSSGTVPPSYEEVLSSVLCGSLAFDANRDSLNPSPTTPRSRKQLDSSPRSFKMSPTPSRVAPATPAEEEDVMVRLANEQNAYHTMTVPHIQAVKKEDNENSIFHRSNSDPPPSYDDVIHMTRDVTSCPEFQLQQGVEYSVGSGNISIISTSGVNGLVLSDLEQSAQLASSKSRRKRRMRHTMCGCVIVLLVVAVSVLIVLMTSGTLLANHEQGQRTTTPPPTSKSDRVERSLHHMSAETRFTDFVNHFNRI